MHMYDYVEKVFNLYMCVCATRKHVNFHFLLPSRCTNRYGCQLTKLHECEWWKVTRAKGSLNTLWKTEKFHCESFFVIKVCDMRKSMCYAKYVRNIHFIALRVLRLNSYTFQTGWSVFHQNLRRTYNIQRLPYNRHWMTVSTTDQDNIPILITPNAIVKWSVCLNKRRIETRNETSLHKLWGFWLGFLPKSLTVFGLHFDIVEAHTSCLARRRGREYWKRKEEKRIFFKNSMRLGSPTNLCPVSSD